MYLLICDETIIKTAGCCEFFVIDERFSHIAKYAFSNISFVEKLIIKKDVTIEKHAFFDSKIKHLTFEKSLDIETSTFAEMHNLQQVDFLEPPTSLQKDAFIRTHSTIGEYVPLFLVDGFHPKIEYDNKVVFITTKSEHAIDINNIAEAFSKFIMYDMGNVKFGGIHTSRTPNYLMEIKIIDD